MRKINAWAVIAEEGFMAPSFDERLWIFDYDHKEQADACCVINNGERVVCVKIVVEDSE